MRLVDVKTPEQQGLGMIFRLRDLFIGQRTQMINPLRGHLAEFGIVSGKGRKNVSKLRLALEQDEQVADLRAPIRHMAQLRLDQIAWPPAILALQCAWLRPYHRTGALGTPGSINPEAAARVAGRPSPGPARRDRPGSRTTAPGPSSARRYSPGSRRPPRRPQHRCPRLRLVQRPERQSAL